MAEPLPPDDDPAPADPPPPPLSVAVVSDLHLEARALEVDAVLDPELTADVLCLLGDIGDPSTPAYAAFIAACAARFPTVLLLAGNNEYRNREPQRHPHKHHHRHSHSNSHSHHRRSQDQARPPSTEEGRTATAASSAGGAEADASKPASGNTDGAASSNSGGTVSSSSGAVSSSSGAGGAGGRTMSDTEALIRSVASRHPNVHFLQNGVFESRGVAFIGSTLWSYLPEDPLPPPPGAEDAKREQAQGPAPEPTPGAAPSGPAPAGPAPETAAFGPSVGPTSAQAGPHPAPAASASLPMAAPAAASPLSAPESAAGRVPPPRVPEIALADRASVVPLRAESLPTWSGSGLPLTAPSGGLGVELEAARAESLPLAAAFACLCANHEHPELHAGSGSGAAGSGSGFGSSVPPGCRALRCRGRFMKRVVSLARLPPDAPCPPVFGGGGGGRHGSREGSKEGAAVEGAGLLVMGSSVGASSTGTGSGSRSSSGSESGSDSGSSSGSEDEPGSGSGSESEAEEKVEAGKQGQAALAAAQGPGLGAPTAAAPAGGPVDSSPAPSPPSVPAASTSGPATESKPSAEPPHTHHRRRPSASQGADPSTETTTITTVRSFIGATSLDYRLIPSAPGGAPITPDTTNALFAAAVEFIAGAVAGARARGLVPVVLTHHAPSLAGTSHPRFAGHPSTHAYGTDLVPYLHGTGIAAWYCGHTHYNFDVRLPCGLRLASNQFGSQPAPVAGYSRSWRQEIAVPAGAASPCSDGASKEAPPFPLPLAPPPAHASPAEADAAAVVRVVPVTAKGATGVEHERALDPSRPLGEACCGGSCGAGGGGSGAGVGAPASPRPLRGAALGPSRLGRAPSTVAAAAGGRSA